MVSAINCIGCMLEKVYRCLLGRINFVAFLYFVVVCVTALSMEFRNLE